MGAWHKRRCAGVQWSGRDLFCADGQVLEARTLFQKFVIDLAHAGCRDLTLAGRPRRTAEAMSGMR